MSNRRTWGDPIGSGAGGEKHNSNSRWPWQNGSINDERNAQKRKDRKAKRAERRRNRGS